LPKISERTTIDCEFIDVAEILTYRPSDWMLPFFRIASQEGEVVGAALRAALKMGRQGPTPPREVTIEFDDPEQVLGGAIALPFRWRATGYPALFKVLNGRLVIWSPSQGSSKLAFEGVCDLPAGVTDDVLGATVATQAAEAAARSLLERLTVAIEEDARTRHGRV